MTKSINKTFSITEDTLEILKQVSRYYSTNQSSALRLAILETARRVGILCDSTEDRESLNVK
jgi:hypothetical protein